MVSQGLVHMGHSKTIVYDFPFYLVPNHLSTQIKKVGETEFVAVQEQVETELIYSLL